MSPPSALDHWGTGTDPGRSRQATRNSNVCLALNVLVFATLGIGAWLATLAFVLGPAGCASSCTRAHALGRA